jgi:hypothetical protein
MRLEVFSMRNILSKLLVFICVIVLATGSTLSVSASESKALDSKQLPTPAVNFDKDAVAEFKLELTQVSNNAPLSKGVDIEEIKKGLQSTSSSKDGTDNVSPQTLTDPYEPNDDSGTAATISYNQYTYANIGTAIDQDWYKINLTVSSDPDEIVAFLLKDIPAGCDYDLYIFDPNFNYAASQNPGNADERIYIDVQTSGTWYVVVVPYSGYNDNANYKLFVGDAWQNGTTGWMPTNLTFNFTSSNVGTILPYQIFDLSYDASIPDSAVVRYIQIDSTGTGNWGNQVKYLYSAQTDTWYETFVGLDYVLDIPEDTLYVKQQWPITTKIQYLYTPIATWTPNIYFAYKYIIE